MTPFTRDSLEIQPRVKSLRSSYTGLSGDTTPCRMTGVTLDCGSDGGRGSVAVQLLRPVNSQASHARFRGVAAHKKRPLTLILPLAVTRYGHLHDQGRTAGLILPLAGGRAIRSYYPPANNISLLPRPMLTMQGEPQEGARYGHLHDQGRTAGFGVRGWKPEIHIQLNMN